MRRKLHTISTDSQHVPNNGHDSEDALIKKQIAEGIANPRSQVDMFSKEFDVLPTQNVNYAEH